MSLEIESLPELLRSLLWFLHIDTSWSESHSSSTRSCLPLASTNRRSSRQASASATRTDDMVENQRVDAHRKEPFELRTTAPVEPDHSFSGKATITVDLHHTFWWWSACFCLRYCPRRWLGGCHQENCRRLRSL